MKTIYSYCIVFLAIILYIISLIFTSILIWGPLLIVLVILLVYHIKKKQKIIAILLGLTVVGSIAFVISKDVRSYDKTPSLTNEDLDILSLEWNNDIVWSMICDRCNRGGRDCNDSVNSGNLEVSLDYSKEVQCSISVDNIKVSDNYHVTPGRQRLIFGMGDIRQGHNVEICCDSVCKIETIERKCDLSPSF